AGIGSCSSQAGAMTRPLAIAGLLWPADQVAEALAAVAEAAGLAGGKSMLGVPPVAGRGAGVAGLACEVADPGGLPGAEIEIDSVEISWADLGRALPRLGPGVMRLGEPVAGCLALLRRRGGRVSVLTPDGRRRRLGGT